MTYKGHVKNGVVVFDEPICLPEGTAVSIAPAEDAAELAAFRDALLRFSGVVKGLPTDLAKNHDHYLHGAPLV